MVDRSAATSTSTTPHAKVAVISSVHRWNDTRIFVKQASSLVAHGYDVVLIGIGDDRSPFERSGVKVVLQPRRRRAMRWLTWFSILRLVLTERAAIVHAHDPELIPLLVFLNLLGRRTICDVHENVAEQVLHKEWVPKLIRRPLSAVLKATNRWLPKLTDAVILAEDSYRRDFPTAANVAVVRNFPAVPPGFKRDYRSDVLRLIYVGDVRKVRGVGEYVSIAERLSRRGVPVEIRVVGSFADRGEEQQIKQAVRDLGLETRVLFLGRRPPEEIPDLIRQCDVGLALLHPIGNYRESYPTKMFEYMAAGVPVVASDFALWRSVLVGNECGRVVNPLDVEQATAALAEYWASPELRERHGRSGRAAVVERYNWDVEVRQLMAIYERLAL